MSLPFILLIIANCFMTLAWYGHLKFLPGVPLWQAILFSWFIALVEYSFMIPATRMLSQQGWSMGEMKITQEIRQEGYDNKTTTDDHGMHIVGLFKDQNGTKYFLVKNSWGTGNYPEGYLYVSENYFKYKTINIYLHKDGLSKELKKKLAIN